MQLEVIEWGHHASNALSDTQQQVLDYLKDPENKSNIEAYSNKYKKYLHSFLAVASAFSGTVLAGIGYRLLQIKKHWEEMTDFKPDDSLRNFPDQGAGISFGLSGAALLATYKFVKKVKKESNLHITRRDILADYLITIIQSKYKKTRRTPTVMDEEEALHVSLQ